MIVLFRLRRDTSLNWQSLNPILASGEIGYETDTLKSKAGDGSRSWNDLPYSWEPIGQLLSRFVDVPVAQNSLLALDSGGAGTLITFGNFFTELAAAETAEQARAILGLGTMAEQDASAVEITGGSITGTNLNE